MPLDVRIISNGTTYYLTNSNNQPTQGGSATAPNTTPYSINVKEWTQTAARREMIYSGAPPFRVGSSPLYAGYNNVTETLEIGISGSNSDNVASLIRTLRTVLNTALYTVPALLYWQPNAASQPVYFEIYNADVQEIGSWQNPSAGFSQVLCKVTWTRSAVGGLLTTGQTLFNLTTVTNTGASNANTVPLGTSGLGDFIYNGSPLNVVLTTTSGGFINIYTWYLAVIAAQSWITGAAINTATAYFPNTPWPVGAHLRVLAYLSGSLSTTQIRATITNGSWGNLVYRSPWVDAPLQGIYDLGGVSLSKTYDRLSPISQFYVSIGSQNGTPNLGAINILQAYTFCNTRWPLITQSNIQYQITTFNEISNMACLPYSFANASLYDANGFLLNTTQLVGTPPAYYSGASLWSMLSRNNLTQQSRLLCIHAPLYHTLRGNG
jgi:hypothetical protein